MPSFVVKQWGDVLAISGTSEIIANIYQTVEDERTWKNVLSNIALDLGADSSVIYTVNMDVDHGAYTSPIKRNSGGLWILDRFEESAAHKFMNYYANIDPCIKNGSAKKLLDGRIITTQQLFGDNELHRTEYYNDFWRPLGVEHMMTGPQAAQWSGVVPTIQTVMYRGKSKTPFDEHDVRKFEVYRFHIKQALILKSAIREKAAISTASALVGLITAPAILLDHHLTVLAINDPASCVVNEGEFLNIQKGRLVPTSSSRGLFNLLADQISSRGCSASIVAEGIHRDRSKRCVYHVLAMGLPWPAGGQSDHVIVVLHLQNRTQHIDWHAVGVTYGLTQAEIKVTSLLLNGKRIEDIAELLSITKETVRTHIKRILHKTYTERQTDLVRLILSMFGNSIGR